MASSNSNFSLNNEIKRLEDKIKELLDNKFSLQVILSSKSDRNFAWVGNVLPNMTLVQNGQVILEKESLKQKIKIVDNLIEKSVDTLRQLQAQAKAKRQLEYNSSGGRRKSRRQRKTRKSKKHSY